MATKYIAKFDSTAALLAASPDRVTAQGFGFVDDVLYANVDGSAVRFLDGGGEQSLAHLDSQRQQTVNNGNALAGAIQLAEALLRGPAAPSPASRQ